MSRSTSPKRRKQASRFLIADAGACWASHKIKWPTRAGARQHERWLRSSGTGTQVARLGTYRCHACDHWHVGHRPELEGEH